MRRSGSHSHASHAHSRRSTQRRRRTGDTSTPDTSSTHSRRHSGRLSRRIPASSATGQSSNRSQLRNSTTTGFSERFELLGNGKAVRHRTQSRYGSSRRGSRIGNGLSYRSRRRGSGYSHINREVFLHVGFGRLHPDGELFFRGRLIFRHGHLFNRSVSPIMQPPFHRFSWRKYSSQKTFPPASMDACFP